MTEITFLGVGGAMAANPADNHTAVLVRDPAATILLDCGPAIMRQMEQRRVSAGELTHLFLTHQHGDHTLGVPMLLLNRWLFWPERCLRILGTPLVLSAAQRLVEVAYPDLVDRLDRCTQFVPVDVAQEPLALPGASSIRYSLAPGHHSVPTWGIRLDLDSGRSLVYSGDTGPSSRIARLATRTDLMIHDTFYLDVPAGGELHHTPAEQVGELAARARVGTVALVHREDTSPELAHRFLSAAARYFDGPILVPSAGDRFTL